MEKDLGGLVATFIRKLGFGSNQRDLIPPPSITTRAPLQKKNLDEQVRVGVKPSMSDISQMPEVKIDPGNFNKRNKN